MQRAWFFPVALCLGACQPTGPTNDSTPPGFVGIEAEYVRVADNRSTGVEQVPVAGFVKANLIGQDRRLVLTVVAGDSESGVASISRRAEATWTCTDLAGGIASRKTATYDPVSDEVRTGTWAGGRTLATATFTVDPFSGSPLRLVCPASQEQSPVRFTTTITLQNGAGAPASTGVLAFTWAGRAAP